MNELSVADVMDDEELRAQLQAAFQSAFPSKADLGQLVTVHLKRNIEELTDRNRIDLVITDLVFKRDEGDRWIRKLVHAASMEKPDNELLRAFTARVGWLPPPPSAADLELSGLDDLAKTRSTRRYVMTYCRDIGSTSDCANAVGALKDMHDLLDQVRHSVYERLRSIVGRLPAVDAMGDLASSARHFSDLLDKLRVGAAATGSADEFPWVGEDLEYAGDVLKRALREPRAELVTEAIGFMRQVIEVQLTGLDHLLAKATKELDLPELISRLQAMHGELADDGVAAARLEALEHDIATLGQIDSRLSVLMAAHHKWQRIDARVNNLEMSLGQSLDDIARNWLLLQSRLAKLEAADGVDELAETIVAFADAVKSRNLTEVFIAFTDLSTRLRNKFFAVDRMLLKECEHIRAVGSSLSGVVEKLDA